MDQPAVRRCGNRDEDPQPPILQPDGTYGLARAVRFATGVTAWQHRTNAQVQTVRELVNGTVAISAAPGRHAPGSLGRLTVVDPR